MDPNENEIDILTNDVLDKQQQEETENNNLTGEEMIEKIEPKITE